MEDTEERRMGRRRDLAVFSGGSVTSYWMMWKQGSCHQDRCRELGRRNTKVLRDG